VTLLTAWGLQKVLTSVKTWAVPVKRCPKSIPTPLRASFSVATINASLVPFQSKELFNMVSIKSPFGK